MVGEAQTPKLPSQYSCTSLRTSMELHHNYMEALPSCSMPTNIQEVLAEQSDISERLTRLVTFSVL
jgi:hypothetical protein